MRSGVRFAALVLLLAWAAGCNKQPRDAPPPVAQAPSLPPAEMASLEPPMPPGIPADQRPVKLDTTVPPEVKTAPVAAQPKKPVRHRTKPASDTAQQDSTKASGGTQTAGQENPSENAQIASAQPSEMSPIGQLSTANPDANTADRHTIIDQIDATENGLNGIKRSLSRDEQKTATQIRTFITRARDALKHDDLDGARTLSTKAHLLLQELISE